MGDVRPYHFEESIAAAEEGSAAAWCIKAANTLRPAV
jgi:hypothetical protein